MSSKTVIGPGPLLDGPGGDGDDVVAALWVTCCTDVEVDADFDGVDVLLGENVAGVISFGASMV